MKTISRKHFIKNTVAASVALSLPTFLQACDDDSVSIIDDVEKSKAPIIVIGAGVAGLATAKRLMARGFTNIIVLEAQNRIGGRIFTDHSLGFPVDMGASWIHGPSNKNPITGIASEAKASTFITDDESLLVYDVNGKAISDSKMDDYYSNYSNLLKKIASNSSNSKSVKTVLQEVDKTTLDDLIMQYQFSAYMEFDSGGDIANLSSASWDNDENFSGADVVLPNGYDEVVNHLAKNIIIEKETIVQSIDYQGTELVLKTNKGDKKAKYVVCTLPLGVLKSGKISFSPALPNPITNAIANLKVGTINKVALVWDTCFWDKNVQYIGYTSQEKGAYSYFMNVKKFLPNLNMLMTFGFGNYGESVENQTDTEIKNNIMSILKKIYGSTIPQPKQILVSRWGKDEFAKGSYSYFNVGASDSDFKAFETVVDGKLFFAGEHSNLEYRGTVHGAYLSGLRAADAL